MSSAGGTPMVFLMDATDDELLAELVLRRHRLAATVAVEHCQACPLAHLNECGAHCGHPDAPKYTWSGGGIELPSRGVAPACPLRGKPMQISLSPQPEEGSSVFEDCPACGQRFFTEEEERPGVWSCMNCDAEDDRREQSQNAEKT